MCAKIRKLSWVRPPQTSYIVNAFVQIGLSILLLFHVPTHLSGLLLMFSSVLYLIAAKRGEEKLTIEEVMKL